MKVLIMNPILYTSEKDEIPKVKSIKDTMIYALCLGFIENGDEPVLLAADSYKPCEEEQYPFEIVWLPCQWTQIFKPRCLPWLKGLGKYIKKNKKQFDYIISSEVFSMLTLSGAIHARSKLIVWHELGAHNNLLKKLPSKIWYNVIARLFMKGLPVIPRSVNAQQFISQYCDKVCDVRIDHGVDLQKITSNRNKNDSFVVVSQLIERKHIDGIIRNFAAFYRMNHESYSLTIIGDGELGDWLKGLAIQEGVPQAVHFAGKLTHTELLPILNQSKALLVNTSKDNSMVSIVESIAAGTPVITTSIPFNASYISEYSLGIVDDNWGPEQLQEISANNAFYVENCMTYRSRLSNRYQAEQFNQIGGTLA